VILFTISIYQNREEWLGKLSWVDAMIITFSIAKIVEGSRQAGKPLLRQFAVCSARSASAVCGLPSAVHIRLFVSSFVDGLPPRQARKPLLPPVHRLHCPSVSRRPRSFAPPAVCRPYSFIRFSHSLTVCLLDRLESLSYGSSPSAVRGLRSALRSAVRRPYSFIRFPIR
jgi:hypothetical protein